MCSGCALFTHRFVIFMFFPCVLSLLFVFVCFCVPCFLLYVACIYSFALSTLRILGDSFLRTFYTAYNVEEKKVGLAQATGKRTDEACAADASISVDATAGAVASPTDTSTLSLVHI